MTGFLYAIAAAVTWGAVYTIDQKVLHNISPFELLFLSSIISACIILPFVWYFEHGNFIGTILAEGKANALLIVLSIVLAMCANFFIYSSIKTLGASTASIIEISYPFFVALFSMLVFRTAPSLALYAGGFCIFIGSAIITYFH